MFFFFLVIPGDHFLLFVGGTTAAAQVLARCGQEVKAVVLKSLINQWKQNLRRKKKITLIHFFFNSLKKSI